MKSLQKWVIPQHVLILKVALNFCCMSFLLLSSLLCKVSERLLNENLMEMLRETGAKKVITFLIC